MGQTGSKSSPAPLEAPRFENAQQFQVAGFFQQYTYQTLDGIPAQWARFAPYIGKIPGQVSKVGYGVCFPASKGVEGVEYLTGVEVSGAAALPAEFSLATIPASRYAVFTHRGHVSTLRATHDRIRDSWPKENGPDVGPGIPKFFERYSEEFDPQTGTGGIEIWVPVKA